MRINVLGTGFDNLTREEAIDRAYALMPEHRGAYVVTPNPEIVMLCRDDPDMAAAVDGADLVIPDGIGVIYGAKILGTPLKEKVPGIDFTTGLMQRMARDGRTAFLFGSKPGVAEAAAENLKKQIPGLLIAGTNDGYFKDDAPIIEKINAAKPDLLLVCLGAPKQEKWMHANREKLDVGLMIGAGGSLDVFAGVAERAPEKWQKAGLEWLYRLLKEPTRLGRMMKLPHFLLLVVGKKLGGGRHAG